MIVQVSVIIPAFPLQISPILIIGLPRVLGSSNYLQDLGAQRRRNLQIKKRVVLSPTKDDKGDYLESGRGEADDSKRLKRVFFETFL